MNDSKEIAVATILDANIKWAKMAAAASILPRHYQDQPANLLIACEYADALGIPRAQVLTDIQVINGRPSMSAGLMQTLVRKAGHKLRVTGDESHAVATLVRADDPEFEYRVEWNEAKARRAGLWGNKGPWTNFPDAMLRARAISEVIRMGAADCLSGIAYTPDELRESVVSVNRQPSTVVVDAVVEEADVHPEPADLDEVQAIVDECSDMTCLAAIYDGLKGVPNLREVNRIVREAKQRIEAANADPAEAGVADEYEAALDDAAELDYADEHRAEGAA